MTGRQITALRKHADRLDARAATARKHFDDLREAFGSFSAGGSYLMAAATAADHAVDDARDFRAQLTRLEDTG